MMENSLMTAGRLCVVTRSGIFLPEWNKCGTQNEAIFGGERGRPLPVRRDNPSGRLPVLPRHFIKISKYYEIYRALPNRMN
jgi:hypothetical protein